MKRRERETGYGYAFALPVSDEKVKGKIISGNRMTHNEVEQNIAARVRNVARHLISTSGEEFREQRGRRWINSSDEERIHSVKGPVEASKF